MKSHAKFLMVALAVSTLGCGMAAAKVSVVQSPSPALARGNAYAWAPLMGEGIASSNPEINNPIVLERLQGAIESSMAMRGYRKIDDAEKADLIISYHVVLRDMKDVSISGVGAICGPRLRCTAPTSYSVNEQEYTQGTLVLDLRERASGNLVWRATSDKKVKSKDASQEKLNKELLKMTESLPPA